MIQIVMPDSNPRDGFFYLPLIPMTDSCILAYRIRISVDYTGASKSYLRPRGGGGGGVKGNLGVIVVRVCEPEFRNLPHSYTWPLKKWTHSYT